ncbi:MAG: 50S ribosomal protein L18, partial [Marinirhabdus sp.]
MALSKQDRRKRIHYRIRKIVSGTGERPRLAVYRSNKEIYAQVIDDVQGRTLAAASSRDNDLDTGNATKTEAAKMVGKSVAEKAQKAGI